MSKYLLNAKSVIDSSRDLPGLEKPSSRWFLGCFFFSLTFFSILRKCASHFVLSLTCKTPANISVSDQRCFFVVDQRWNNVDPVLKMKQNPTSDFQLCTTLIQRHCTTLKQRRRNVTQRRDNIERWYNVVSN